VSVLSRDSGEELILLFMRMQLLSLTGASTVCNHYLLESSVQ
jgi:hypothetical protein